MHDDKAVLLRTLPLPVEQIRNNKVIDDAHVRVTHRGNKLTAYIKAPLNIRITATWRGRHMSYQLFVPCFLCQISFGILGICDGNPNNDVAGPNDCE